MKALVLMDYHKFEYTSVPDPEPGEDEVVVRIKACAICGSDIHGCGGGSGRRIPPIIMGHEASGVIAKIGAAVKGWQIGDRVTFDSTEYCGTCWFCRNGYHNLCASRRILGVACADYRKEGAMAEYAVVKSRCLYALPSQVSFEEASLVEPLAVGMHAARMAGKLSGKTAAVIGAGTIGLMTLLAAKSKGAAHVLISGHHAYRQQAALRMGAEAAAEGKDELVFLVSGVTDGRGADVVFDSVGTQESFETAMTAVRAGGMIVCIGNAVRDITFPLQECIVKQISVICSYSSEGEYPECLQAIAWGSVDLGEFLHHVMPLQQGAEAFDRLIRREEGLLKVILKP